MYCDNSKVRQPEMYFMIVTLIHKFIIKLGVGFINFLLVNRILQF